MIIRLVAVAVMCSFAPGAYTSGQAASEAPPVDVERPTGPVDSCVTTACHTRTVTVRFLHGPTAQRRCDACHTVDDIRKHTFSLALPAPDLCDSCHTRSERSVVHKPVLDRECVKCHDPHGSDHPKHLLADPSRALCLMCHKPEEHGRNQGTEAVAAMAGACDACHEYHSSWLPNLLPTDRQRICVSCHTEMWSRLELIGAVHAPVLDGRCLDCHDAHTTTHPGQLREAVPNLCYSCHEHDDMRARIETSSVVHGAITTDDSCNACHLGHGGVLPKLLAGSEKDLCVSCHNEPLTTDDGRVLTDMACLLKENPRHHGPIREGKCGACHDPHAASRTNLLTRNYPDVFYAPFDTDTYALCFECHIETLATAERGMGATGFRDGDVNLHFVHVYKEKRGRTCLTCHEVHASLRPFHMRETVRFGPRDWEVEINFAKLPSGGLCSPACHDTKPYDRGDEPQVTFPRSGLKPELLE